MAATERRDVCEITDCEDGAGIVFPEHGLRIEPQPNGDMEEAVLAPDTGDFAKWLRATHPERFVSGMPKLDPLPKAVWINPPAPASLSPSTLEIAL